MQSTNKVLWWMGKGKGGITTRQPYPCASSTFSFIFPSCNTIHTCPCNYKKANFEVGREARFMKRLMIGTNKPSRKFYNVVQPVSKVFTDLATSTRGGPSGKPMKSKKCLRRVDVLSTVFMEQITSMLSTGEACEEIMGLGLTISRVKISSDFSRVNVYWVASGTEKDDEIEPILKKAAGKLRHDLSQLRVIGMVPPIEFVKDKGYSTVAEVEHILKKCDFGTDFVPTPSRKLFLQVEDINKAGRSNKDPYEALDKEVESILETGGSSTTDKEELLKTETGLYKSIPLMRQDMLGVKYVEMMANIKELNRRIQRKKTGSSIPEADSAELDEGLGGSSSTSDPSQTFALHSSVKEEVAEAKKRQQEFFKYLKKRQLARDSMIKQTTTAFKEKEFYDEEAHERWEAELSRRIQEHEFREEEEDQIEYEDYSSRNLDNYK